MKAIKVLAIAGVTGVMVAGAITSPALAWHPKGVIKKFVQNQTAGTALSDANEDTAAVAAKPGDVLKYVVEINNIGAAGQTNEMHFTKLTDNLPAGVELVSDPAKRQIVEDLGIVKPGEKKTKEYLVKVTSTKDKDLIDNKACFTGDSEVHDNHQEGCDNAKIRLSVPPKPEEPKPQPPKVEPPKPEAPKPQPQVLPATGPSALLAPVMAIGSGTAAYAGRLLVIKRRQK
jgi:uncharacterized repeat protein (TIGR01451 family)